LALALMQPNNHPYPVQVSPNTYAVPAGMHRAEFPSMGTTVSLLLPQTHFYAAIGEIQQLFAEWEQILSRFRPDSELSRLNRHAGQPIVVSQLLFNVLRQALQAAQETDGIYDPTLLHQLEHIGYDRSFEQLEQQHLHLPTTQSAATIGGGWRSIHLDARHQRVTLPEGVGIDFGGIAKGMAVDAAIVRLQRMGIENAIVNAGGDLAVLGLPPGEESWPIEIHGKDESWVIPFHHGAIATSGVGYRQWLQGEQKRHHIIDPRTGESAASSLWSVTVAASHCTMAEVATKAAFILGPDEGGTYIANHALASLFVHEDGSWTTAGSWPAQLMQRMENKQ
jgi:FAD:protein FMN transferase